MKKIRKIILKPKPKNLFNWYLIGETEKCYILVKTKDYKKKDKYYLPKKDVLELKE